MRYHKVTPLTEIEARSIINCQTTSLNECVVIEHFGQWFDVRRMTEQELEDFVFDLRRARSADLAAGLITPH